MSTEATIIDSQHDITRFNPVNSTSKGSSVEKEPIKFDEKDSKNNFKLFQDKFHEYYSLYKYNHEKPHNEHPFAVEKWIENNIPARVSELGKEFVVCECLMDKEKSIFENRTFPKVLFQHIHGISTNSYVLISMKSKPGSIRFDVYKGEPYFNKTIFHQSTFESEDIWKKLESNNFDDKFDYRR